MTALAPSRRGFLGGLTAAFATPAIIRVAPLMPIRTVPPAPPPLALLNPNTETISWMGGIFNVPIEAVFKDPGLFQKLCTLYGDPSARRISPGQRPVFNADFTLNERATAMMASWALPSHRPLRGVNAAEAHRFAVSDAQRSKILET